MSNLVSILIPAYNAEKFIRATIRSALVQSWPDKEIVIVNDGSRDGTLALARRYETKSVKVVTQENQGACAARNKALAFAQGDYIQWLDADDLLAPDKISKQLEGAEPGSDSRILLTSAFGSFFFRHQKARFQPNSLWQDLTPVEWLLAKVGENAWMNPTSWLVSRKLTDLAGPWDQRLSNSGDDDGEYVCRVVARSDKVRFISEAKCYYRIGNVGSLNWVMGESTQRLESLLLSLRLTMDHLLSLDDSEKSRSACLRFLETWFPLFYPEEKWMIEKLQLLAGEMGGTISTLRLSWKYHLIMKILGARFAKKLMVNWRKTALLARKNWDGLLHNIESKRESMAL